MFWFEVWECLMKRKKPVLTEEQAKYLPQLEERAAAIKRLDARCDRHKKKYKTMPTKGVWLSFDYKYREYYETAKYFETYYDEIFKKRDKPLILEPHDSEAGRSAYGSRAPQTKNKNYRHQKYRKNIKCVYKELKQEGKIDEQADENYKQANYNTLLATLYLRLPVYAFEPQERKVIQEIFQFAQNKKFVFQVTKRSSRRNTEKLKKTYSEFCVWYSQHKAEYSCKNRFFVPLFCKNDTFILQENISSLFVSNLLRYDIFPDCFTENDLKAMGVRKNAKLFFKVMKQIRETSQKK